MIKPIVWTIAGSDSGGGAGIQADLAVFNNLETFGCSAITVLTAQNSLGVVSIQETTPEVMRDQLQCLQDDLPPKVVKIGMLFSEAIMQEVHTWLESYDGPVICDPVMVATSGDLLLQESAKDFLIDNIMAKSTCVTPNIFETEMIVGYQVRSPEKVLHAARDILARGAKSVLIKGGHGDSDYCHDYWSDGKQSTWVSSKRHSSNNNHGSGCSLSSAVAAFVARDERLLDAIVLAKTYINQGFRLSEQYGAGPGPLGKCPMQFDAQDIPSVHDVYVMDPQVQMPSLCFPPVDDGPIGIYPVVDSVDWVEKLAPLPGVSTIQLRIKGVLEDEARQIISAGIIIARDHNVRLFVNDHWQIAIELGAYGVHLGQEDLSSADLGAIAQAGLRLGISTHGAYEMARGLQISPSYVAFGTIFESLSKPKLTSWQGLDKLSFYNRLANVPVVAIGGITTENIQAVAETGVDGIAMISAVTQTENFEEQVAKLYALIVDK